MELLVTVGSTEFAALTDACAAPEFLDMLVRRGFTALTVQHGTAPFCYPALAPAALELRAMRYSSTLGELIARSAAVVAHGGAGTTMEVLRAGKPLITVINRALLDDHQNELALQMLREGRNVVATPRYLSFCGQRPWLQYKSSDLPLYRTLCATMDAQTDEFFASTTPRPKWSSNAAAIAHHINSIVL